MIKKELIDRAKHLVTQYDKHGKPRETDADRLLYALGEPDDVALARGLLEAVRGLHEVRDRVIVECGYLHHKRGEYHDGFARCKPEEIVKEILGL